MEIILYLSLKKFNWKKVKDNFEINIVFPSDYHADNLKNKKARFEITVNVMTFPEDLKDDTQLATKLGAKNIVELREKIKNDLSRYSEELSFAIIKNQIIKNITSHYKFELPPTLVAREEEIIKRNFTKGKADKKNEDDKNNKKILHEAENKVKIGIVLSEIGIKFKINVTSQEIENELARICLQYPGKEKEIVEFYKNNPSQMNSLKSPIFENKVIKLISEKAKTINEKLPQRNLIQK